MQAACFLFLIVYAKNKAIGPYACIKDSYGQYILNEFMQLSNFIKSSNMLHFKAGSLHD